MSKINKSQATDLSRDFDAAATAVSNYLVKNYAVLKKEEIEQLRGLRWTLFDLAEEITQRAIGQNLSNLEGGLPTIQNATENAIKVVARLKKVATVVSVVSEVINLALSVSTGNVEGIAKAAAEIIKLGKEEKSDKDNKPDKAKATDQ